MTPCDRCGRNPRPGYPCDSVDCTVERVIRYYPALFTNRTAALDHLLRTIGNGYEWDRGALVDIFWHLDAARRRREHADGETFKPVEAMPPAKWMDETERAEAHAAYEAEKARLRDISARAAELATVPGPLGTDPWQILAIGVLEHYPREHRRRLVDRLRVQPLPPDAREDWKAAADELEAVLGPARAMLLDRLDAADAEAADRLATIRAAATLLKNGDTRFGGPVGWSLGALLSTIANQGHDMHESPLRPANSGVWECTACGHLDVSPEKCPGMYAYQVAMFVRED